jgi:K+-transporting ATPase ATPase A chain
MLWQFISAATGIAICAVVFNAMKEGTTDKLGNFYNYFIRSATRILLPLAIVVALILVFNGTPMNFEGKAQYISLQGDTVTVSRGPAAAIERYARAPQPGRGLWAARPDYEYRRGGPERSGRGLGFAQFRGPFNQARREIVAFGPPRA